MKIDTLCVAVGFDDHISTYIVDRDIVDNADRNLVASDLKDFLLDAAEDTLDGDQGELFLDTTDSNGTREFWKQYDELVD